MCRRMYRLYRSDVCGHLIRPTSVEDLRALTEPCEVQKAFEHQQSLPKIHRSKHTFHACDTIIDAKDIENIFPVDEEGPPGTFSRCSGCDRWALDRHAAWNMLILAESPALSDRHLGILESRRDLEEDALWDKIREDVRVGAYRTVDRRLEHYRRRWPWIIHQFMFENSHMHPYATASAGLERFYLGIDSLVRPYVDFESVRDFEVWVDWCNAEWERLLRDRPGMSVGRKRDLSRARDSIIENYLIITDLDNDERMSSGQVEWVADLDAAEKRNASDDRSPQSFGGEQEEELEWPVRRWSGSK